ncbi:MAG: c-type cytochrome [Sulfurovum sp.]|nr:c-type cytochrome [Sulfurovum sp.]
MADAAAEKAAEVKVAAEAKAAEAAAAVKEKAAELTESVTTEPPAAYAKCKGCHGADGKTKALGKSAVIAGQDKAAIITSMNEYKAGTKNVAGMGMLMKGQAASMSDEEIEAVAEYLSKI